MHEELYVISEQAADRLNQAMADKKRIVAVGTTSVRTLESNYQDGKFTAGAYRTKNFHLPRLSVQNRWCANNKLSFAKIVINHVGISI